MAWGFGRKPAPPPTFLESASAKMIALLPASAAVLVADLPAWAVVAVVTSLAVLLAYALARALGGCKRGGLPPPPTDLLPAVDKRAKDCRRFRALLSYDGAGAPLTSPEPLHPAVLPPVCGAARPSAPA